VLARAKRADAVVIGPGLGPEAAFLPLLLELLQDRSGPLVLDADALNLLAPWNHPGLVDGPPVVLTPHPGEFARLTGLTTGEIQANREVVAEEFARRSGCLLVLKGAGTIVCDGASLYVNATGNPGMATGGTGDILAGMLGALLAQGLPAREAAILAVHVHGLAGDRAAHRLTEIGMIASDLLAEIPACWQLVS
jgi:NAD(P)H-hydrate epimerase